MKPKIVVTRLMTPAVMQRIANEFDAVLAPPGGMNPDQVIEAINSHKAAGLLFTSGTSFNAAYIGRLPETLKIAATCSVGFDHVDVAAAKAKGLVVTNTPDVLTNATADIAFMLLLGAARRAYEYDSVMRKGWGRFFGMDELLGIEVTGKTLGIIGMGRIGQAVARRARGFDMKVLYHSRNRALPEHEHGAQYVSSLEDMLPQCEFLSLHAPGGPATAGMIDQRKLDLLPKGAVFVNTARGTLVDEEALIAALTSGKLAAAGLDVFKAEPKVDERFAQLPNVFLAPHMGSATHETRTAMGALCLDNLAAVLNGRPPITPL